ncbi:hypothetical protein [Micromonospora tulbaghiae]|uniref:hypothetical protein n=1 Tax=Micromonospora tulbaghiae TaxID=479978 RepID=UPI003414084E
MALVGKIEELGAAVDAGLLDRATAVQHLTEYSDGGLTRLGADHMLTRWQTARATYADLMMTAELGLAACEASLRRRGEDGPR